MIHTALVLMCFCFLLVNSQGLKNISDWILANGYPLQVHEALTSDGFYLQLFRIPHGRNSGRAAGKPAHGLGSSCADYFLNFPSQSLADKGYDVWVGNNRGNGYSMKHVKFNTSEDAFWYWTYDEMGSIDLPTMVNYILRQTGKSQLSYAGISQGTTQVWAGLSENHAFAEKFNLFIGFAPVAYLSHQRSILLTAMADLDAAYILELLGNRDFVMAASIHRLLPEICAWFPQQCDNALELEMGPSTHVNLSRLDFYLQYELAPTSIWNMIHWSQACKNPFFQKMDWGQQGNLAHYNQTTPPYYNLSNFPSFLPFALFTGGNDYLADLVDVAALLKQVPPPVQVVNMPSYNHVDYVLSPTAITDIYPQVFALLKKYAR